jgi:hypothetical protein
LPAKFVDAARCGCAVAATPTEPIMEFARDSFIAINDWSDSVAVLARIRSADLRDLGQRIRSVFDAVFSQQATAATFTQLVEDIFSGQMKAGRE